MRSEGGLKSLLLGVVAKRTPLTALFMHRRHCHRRCVRLETRAEKNGSVFQVGKVYYSGYRIIRHWLVRQIACYVGFSIPQIKNYIISCIGLSVRSVDPSVFKLPKGDVLGDFYCTYSISCLAFQSESVLVSSSKVIKCQTWAQTTRVSRLYLDTCSKIRSTLNATLQPLLLLPSSSSSSFSKEGENWLLLFLRRRRTFYAFFSSFCARVTSFFFSSEEKNLSFVSCGPPRQKWVFLPRLKTWNWKREKELLREGGNAQGSTKIAAVAQ